MSAQSGRFDRRIRPAVEKKVRKEGPSENENSELERHKDSFFEEENLIKVLSGNKTIVEQLLSHFENNMEKFKSAIKSDRTDGYELIVDNFEKVYNAYRAHMNAFKSQSSEKQPCKKQPDQNQSGKKQPCKKQPCKKQPDQNQSGKKQPDQNQSSEKQSDKMKYIKIKNANDVFFTKDNLVKVFSNDEKTAAQALSVYESEPHIVISNLNRSDKFKDAIDNDKNIKTLFTAYKNRKKRREIILHIESSTKEENENTRKEVHDMNGGRKNFMAIMSTCLTKYNQTNKNQSE